METLCPLPPAGWYCTRKPGHEGPCAARQTETTGVDPFVFDDEAPEAGESTSALVASTAAKLLGAPNILMRASPFHPAVLQAVKDSGFKVDGKMLDLLEKLSEAIEPFMQDVRIVAGSALTQVRPVVDDPDAG